MRKASKAAIKALTECEVAFYDLAALRGGCYSSTVVKKVEKRYAAARKCALRHMIAPTRKEREILEGKAVLMPTDMEMAETQMIAGVQWLRKHAPRRLGLREKNFTDRAS